MNLRTLTFLGLSLLCVPAIAATGGPAKRPVDAPDHGDTIGTKASPALRNQKYLPANQAEFDARLATFEGRQYPAYIYLGAEALSLSPEFVYETQQGTEMMFKRQYKEGKAHFEHLGVKYRGKGIGPVGQVLIWQAMMIENFDFKYESQYRVAYKRARQELEEALLVPGDDGWEYFMLAGMLGIDSIHAMRREEYVTAFNRGYEAMKAVTNAKEHAPDFADVYLGDGLFDYWATIISRSSKAVPDTADRRQEGITQMVKVELQGIYLRPAATLALTFTWIEEGQRRRALASALKNQAGYPQNVINNLVLGRVYMYNRMYAEAEAAFGEVIKTAPENQRVHYYLGRLYLRQRMLDKALASFNRYLAFPDLDDDDRASALYYVGNLFYKQKNWDEAEKYYKQAWKVGRIKRAKKKIERVKEKRAES